MVMDKMIPYQHYDTTETELYYKEIVLSETLPEYIDMDKVERYKKDILNGDVFPPIEVVKYRHFMEIIEGNHRASAYHLLGKKIPCIIYSEKDMISEEKERRRKKRKEDFLKKKEKNEVKAKEWKENYLKRKLEKEKKEK